MKTPAKHPRKCWVCAGTGRQPGADIKSKANGHDVIYTTVEPCTHDWRDDDEDTDVYGYNTRDPIPMSEGVRIARAEYEIECVRNGRQPNWEWFNAIMGELA